MVNGECEWPNCMVNGCMNVNVNGEWICMNVNVNGEWICMNVNVNGLNVW
jgi:hypothetical protein